MRTIMVALVSVAALAAEPLITDAELAPALTADGRTELAKVRPAASWRIAATVDEDAGTISGTATLAWRNDEAAAVPDVVLQLLANGEPFTGAAMAVEDVRVAGAPATAVPEADGCALRIALPTKLAPGATVRVSCRFTTTPSTDGGLYGLLSRSQAGWALYAWHPELALRRNGSWRAEKTQASTDPTRTAIAHVLLDLTAPADLQVLTGGTAAVRVDGAVARHRIAAPFTRNLAMVLGRGFTAQERTVGGTTVRSWHRVEHGHGGKRVLAACAGSLALFSERFGTYPFNELDAVEAPLGESIGGMESSGLVLMETGPYEAVRWLDEKADASVLPVFLLMVCAAHETGHQWWYGMVGSDPYGFPWLDESLTNWAGNFWMEREGGPGAGSFAFGMCLSGCLGHRQQAMTRRIADFGSFDEYGAVVYARGALFYQWLRHRMGEERFFAFLRAWSVERRWTQATPLEWRETLERFAEPALIAEAEARWLGGRGLTAADLHAGAQAGPAIPGPAPATRP